MSIIKTTKEVASYYKAKFNLNSSAFGTTMAFMLLALVALDPATALATADADTPSAASVTGVVCNVVQELQGPIARGVAAFGIIFLGFSLFLGKISWGVALALGIGIGAIFGANEIVNVLVGDDTTACTGVLIDVTGTTTDTGTGGAATTTP